MYAIAAIVLANKMAAISVAQGRARVATGIFVNPEEARTFGAEEAPEEAPMVQRAARAWRNKLENIPIFLIVPWIYVTAGLSTLPCEIYCIVFVLAQIAHTISYLNAVQRVRTIVFTIGALVTLALIIHLVLLVVLAWRRTTAGFGHGVSSSRASETTLKAALSTHRGFAFRILRLAFGRLEEGGN